MIALTYLTGLVIETEASVRLRVDLRRDAAPATPIIETDPRTHRSGAALATTGIGPDLMQAAKDATRNLVAEVVARTGVAPVDAYLLASIAADLKISEVVDVPNWIVSTHLELSLLD